MKPVAIANFRTETFVFRISICCDTAISIKVAAFRARIRLFRFARGQP
jgi:hypothetical protein